MINQNPNLNQGKIKEVNLSAEMRKSFLSYAMSVIVARALPDIQDGLKPVQRRILYGMKELSVYSNSSYKKAARIVGDVMGKYHPHGDSSIYEAMVRMSQDFSYRYPLVDGHGNFGSIDGHKAAAMRYTEVKMAKIAMELIKNIDKETIEFVDNYDGSEKEPLVLPTAIPNLLINGATGIAVGMATKIPTHNLAEVVDGLIAYIKDKNISILGLMQYIKGPDFPTGGELLGLKGLENAYKTGQGSVIIKAKTHILEEKGKTLIVVTEIPYQIKKSALIEKIAFLVKDKVIEGITDLRDESSRQGMKIVIELKKNANSKVILNQLYKHSPLRISFGINMVALVDKKPQLVSLKTILEAFFNFRIQVINKQKFFELKKAQARKHLVFAFLTILKDIQNAIKLIKNSSDTKDAQQKLMDQYQFDAIQSKAILEMSLQRLSNQETQKLFIEEQKLTKEIAECQSIIESQPKKEKILEKELLEIKKKYQDERRTVLNFDAALDDKDEDLIEQKEIIITITNKGYIKVTDAEFYRQQKRGGKGAAGMKIYEEDFIEHLLFTSTHNFLLFFTNKGRVYQLKGYQINLSDKSSKGIPLVNLLNLKPGETLTSCASVKNFDQPDNYLFFATKKGIVKKTSLKEYSNIRENGKIAIVLRDDDEVLTVANTNGRQNIILASNNGNAICFDESQTRKTSRQSQGVIGMDLKKGEFLIGAALFDPNSKDQSILVMTEKGYGKITSVNQYRIQSRNGKGSKTIKINSKTGRLIALKTAASSQDLIISSDKGQVIRVSISDIKNTKHKATQGTKIIKLKTGHKAVLVAVESKIND
ncbi:DNA gyrase alpha subunit [Candidatus Phytoplasma australiense]|uniref:DNA topoisomerase (ATP-hydrolyzing) n=2 Tax=Phytoplasma australiense TaxID=59748 RepID=B1V9B7_PHYAS|nr:DNA gyrase subunit A [Candidatus Phytoplasma australiense]AGL90663.1 DNA gyrase subunit A [Strawberry lethal yellows phytoplasma (CPA) str. NZSb11]CAM11549.1 DNA gyrase alpha subunit [Candidatus Phytoplasma australiense]